MIIGLALKQLKSKFYKKNVPTISELNNILTLKHIFLRMLGVLLMYVMGRTF